MLSLPETAIIGIGSSRLTRASAVYSSMIASGVRDADHAQARAMFSPHGNVYMQLRYCALRRVDAKADVRFADSPIVYLAYSQSSGFLGIEIRRTIQTFNFTSISKSDDQVTISAALEKLEK